MKQIVPGKKKLRLPRLRIGRKVKLVALIVTIVLVLGVYGGYRLTRAVNDWFAKNELVFNKPLELIVKKPIEVKERQIEVKEIVKVINDVPNPVDLETDTEKYIYEVFGIENYKVAIAVARAESHLREDAIGVNTNGSVDVGIFQINSVHFKKDGCSLKEVATVKGNVDCAKQIYDASGWNPWVAFKNGNFISKLE